MVQIQFLRQLVLRIMHFKCLIAMIHVIEEIVINMNRVPLTSRGTPCSGADDNFCTTIGKIIKRPFLYRLALSGTKCFTVRYLALRICVHFTPYLLYNTAETKY